MPTPSRPPTARAARPGSRRAATRRGLLSALVLLALAPAGLHAAEWPLARWLPGGRVAVLRVDDGAGLGARLPRVLFDLAEPDGRLAAEWLRYRAAPGSDAARLPQVLLGGRFEAALYERGHERLRDDSQGHLELLLVAEPPDPDLARRRLERWYEDAEAAGQPVSRGSYRGTAYLRIGRALVATTLGDRVALSSDDDLLADAIDRELDGERTALPEGPPPGGASLGCSPFLLRGPQLAGAARLRRRLGVPAAALAQLLLGPVDAALTGDSWLLATLVPDGAGLRLDARLPGAPQAAQPCWFPEDARPAPRPASGGALGVLSLSRDVADWWRRRETLMPEEDQARLARLDSDLAELLGGASPGEDLLARLGHDLQLVVDGAGPDGLPAACLIAPLDLEPALADGLVVAFQSAVAFHNLRRGEDGGPALLVEVQAQGDRRLAASRPVAPLGQAAPPAGDGAGWTPCLGLLDGQLLLGTDADQLARLMDDLQAGRTVPGDEPAHLALGLDGAALAALGRQWRPQLVARVLLSRGLAPEAAGETVDRWLASVEQLGRLSLALQADRGDLHLTVTTSGPAREATR